MWKRIGIRGDGSPQQPNGGVQASPLSSSREKYMRKRPLNEDALRERDLSSSRISEHSGRLGKMASESSIVLEGLKHSLGSKHEQQLSAPNKTEQSTGNLHQGRETPSLKSGRKDTPQGDQARQESPTYKKGNPRPSVSFGGTYQLDIKAASNTDRPSGSSSARDLTAEVQMKQSLPPITTSYGTENTTNEYIEKLERKKKEAQVKNIRYERKLEQMKKLETDCSELKKEVAALKKSVYQSQTELEKRFVQETTKKIEEELNRRSKIEQEVLRQTQHERDDLRAKLKAEMDKVNNLKLELEQAKSRMQEAPVSNKQPQPVAAITSKPAPVVENSKPAIEQAVSQPLQKPKEEKKTIVRAVEKTPPAPAKEEEKVVNKLDAIAKPPHSVKQTQPVKEPEVKPPVATPAKTIVTPTRPPSKAFQPLPEKTQPTVQTVEPTPPVKEVPLVKETPQPVLTTPVRVKVETKPPNPEQDKPEIPLQKLQVNTTSLPVMERAYQVERQPIKNPTVREAPTSVSVINEVKTTTVVKQQVIETANRRVPAASKPETAIQPPPTQNEVLKVTKVPQAPAVQHSEQPRYEDSISTILGAISKMRSSITELSNCKQSLQEKASQPEATKTKRVISRTQKISSP